MCLCPVLCLRTLPVGDDANQLANTERCLLADSTGRPRTVRLLPWPSHQDHSTNLVRIPEGLLLAIWRGGRMHRHAGRRHRPLAWLRLSHLQGPEDGQHCHGQGALPRWQDCESIPRRSFHLSLSLSLNAPPNTHMPRSTPSAPSPATNRRRRPRSLSAASARKPRTTSSASTLPSSAVSSTPPL